MKNKYHRYIVGVLIGVFLYGFWFLYASGIHFGLNSNSNYCNRLIRNATKDTQLVSYLKGWATTIKVKGTLEPRFVMQDVGIRPGSARVLANVDWEKLGFKEKPLPEMRLILEKRGNYNINNIDFLFFAERSRFGYIVKMHDEASFSSWPPSTVKQIDEDVAVLCLDQ